MKVRRFKSSAMFSELQFYPNLFIKNNELLRLWFGYLYKSNSVNEVKNKS